MAGRTVEYIRVGEEVGADRQRDHSEGKGHQLEDDAAGEVRNPIHRRIRKQLQEFVVCGSDCPGFESW